MASSEFPAPYVVEPRPGHPHTHTVIFLHGRDSSAHEFANELFESESSPELADSDRTLPALLPTVRWVFPQAPMLQSARFGSEMPQWFDVWTTEDPREAEHAAIQRPGLRRVVSQILHTLESEERLVPTSRIFVCGISQGCAAAIAALISRDGNAWRRMAGLAGVAGLSSWMPRQDKVDEKEQGAHHHRPADSEAWRTLPVMLQHCIDDDVIAVAYGRHLRDELTGTWSHQGVEWREYEDGRHWLNEPRGVDDLVGFLRRCMAKERLPQ